MCFDQRRVHLTYLIEVYDLQFFQAHELQDKNVGGKEACERVREGGINVYKYPYVSGHRTKIAAV